MVLEEKLKACLQKYQNPDVTRKELIKTTKVYESLVIKYDLFEFSSGMKKELLNLTGTIPVPYRGKSYNIPVCIWLLDTHPVNAPICFVCPTPEMCIRTSMHVDHTGKIYLPYLHTWNSSSSLIELIQVMISKFSAMPPVFSKPKTGEGPYPTQQAYVQSSNIGQNPYTSYPMPASTSAAGGYPLMPPSTSAYPLQPSVANQAAYNYPSTALPYPPAQPSYLPYPSTPSVPIETQTSSPPFGTTGTIKEEHLRESVVSAIQDKFRRKLNEKVLSQKEEIDTLKHTERDLKESQNKLEKMMSDLKKEKADVEKNIQLLKLQEEEVDKVLANTSGENSIDIDDIVVTTAPVYKQILNAYCEDLAIEDTIYYVGEALRKGVVDLDVFIKQLRSLSRKQFMLRSLVYKCRSKAGLDV